MRSYKCEMCGTATVTEARGPLPKNCPKCRRSAATQRQRVSRARRWTGPSSYTCVDCGTTGQGRANRQRCDSCKIKAAYQRRVARGQEGPKPERTWTCVDCGATGVQSARGKARMRCGPCKNRYGNRKARDAVDDGPSECAGCGVAFRREARKGPKPTRCPKCTRAYVREYNTTRFSPGPLAPTVECAACGAVADQHPRVPRLYCDPCGGARTREAQVRWWREHPEVQAAKWARKKERRRARQAGVDAELFDRQEIFERDGWRCYLCDEDVDPALAYPNPRCASLDHVIPLAAGGPHTRANTACTHLECNVRKHATIIETMGV